MPGFDGAGPRGMGPMTGGGRGFCNPYGAAYGNSFGMAARGGMGRGMGMRRGAGMGRGMGRGMRYPFAYGTNPYAAPPYYGP
jgi:hypothetical protein